MEKYNVKISPAAQRDFLVVAEHLDALPPDEAMQAYDLILNETEFLLTSPASCSFARDMQLRLRGYRVLTVGVYLIFFVIYGNTVDIRRILYAKRRYERFV